MTNVKDVVKNLGTTDSNAWQRTHNVTNVKELDITVLTAMLDKFQQ